MWKRWESTERESEKEEVQREILAYREDQSLPEELHEGGGQEVAASGYGASKKWEVHAVGMAPTERLKTEETAGSCCGQKEHDLVILLHGGF